MNAITCLETRRSIRKFKETKINVEVIEEIVKTASFAPSWKNTQTARYIIVQDQEIKEAIAKEAILGFEHNGQIIKNCAALAIITCIHGRSGFERDGSFSTSKEDRWEIFDAGIATQTFCLSAHVHGVGSVIMGIFDEDKVKQLAEIEEGQVVCALVGLGYAYETPNAPRRKEVSELLTIR